MNVKERRAVTPADIALRLCEVDVYGGVDPIKHDRVRYHTLTGQGGARFPTVCCYAQSLPISERKRVLERALEAFLEKELPDFNSLLASEPGFADFVKMSVSVVPCDVRRFFQLLQRVFGFVTTP